jgi:hypothetical protein
MLDKILAPRTGSGASFGASCASCALAIASAIGAVSCSDTYETTSLENPALSDPIDDTAPAETSFDPALSYNYDSGSVTSNNSAKRFRFDVMPYTDDSERQNAEGLYPSHARFLAGSLTSGVTIPSVQTVVTYVKQLDDTIYGGVERTVQDGLAPTVEPKRTVLRGALDYLSSHRSAAADDAAIAVAAASRLGGDQPSVPADLSAKVDAKQAEFLASASEAKPIGFYTWSNELKAIWQQDRLLQRELASESACVLAVAIAADPARRAQYQGLVSLYGKLTNPVKSSLVSLLAAASTGTCTTSDTHAFLSRSETPEVHLFEMLYPNGVPPDADLMADLITAIRSGTIDLTPQPADGWYQYQLYALETLLVTDKSEERAKVGFTARYKKRMQEAFSTLLVQHRETHVKQGDVSVPVSAPAGPPKPQFRVEPLATVYVRHARSYVFLEQALDSLLGGGTLDAALAVDAKGKTTDTLRARIHRARDLFYGLYIVSSQDLGFKAALSAAGDPAPDQWLSLTSAAEKWINGLRNDDLANSDVRVMVPIAELSPTRFKYWAVIGVRATLAGYSFIQGTDMSAPPLDQVAKVWLPTEQFLEVESSDVPLSRDEFRALCDQNKTADAIKAAIEARTDRS